MRNFIVFGIVALCIAGAATQFAEKTQPATVSPPSAIGSATSPASTKKGSDQGDPRTLVVRRDDRGHFRVSGSVDGRQMDFLVDTGASSVVLPEREAARIGLRPSGRDYSIKVKTANGTVLAAPFKLKRIEVGWIRLTDVDALVLPDSALSENLLGLSFLSRLRRFEFAQNRLVLEQ